jgi:hypothetical protein
MNGGIELVYMNTISGIQEEVYEGIKSLGWLSALDRLHLPVGCCMAFTPASCPNMVFVSAPTMFIPGDVSKTKNAFWATRSAMVVLKNMDIKDVYTSLMCTGYGEMPKNDAIKQMVQAMSDAQEGIDGYDTFTLGKYAYAIARNEIMDKIVADQPSRYELTEFGVKFS